MALKTYNQNCGLAAALDVLGERWTWLILRGLFYGPARFSELQSQLPGIGTNLLAARLKMLERRGLIERQATGASGYALTSRGEALRPIACQLARWGREFLPIAGGAHQVPWTMFNIEAAFCPDRAAGIEAVVEFRLGQAVFHLVIRRQQCRASPGPAVSPDVVVSSSGESLLGERSRLQIHGDTAMFDRVRPCFDL